MSTRPLQHLSEPVPNEDFNAWCKARGANWIKEFALIFGEPLCGSTRAVFRAGQYVYKVPLSEYGVIDNEHEAAFEDECYAPCRVEHDADGFPILVMECVLYSSWSKIHDWTWSIDGGQVGYSKVSGRLVAYDYGIS